MTEKKRYNVKREKRIDDYEPNNHIINEKGETVISLWNFEDCKDVCALLNEHDKTLTLLEEHCRVKIREARERQIPIHKIAYGGDVGYWRGYKKALQNILELMGVPEEKRESKRFDC